VSLHPSVAGADVTDKDICEHFHDGEGIHVDNARVVYHKDVEKVKMIFVDFKDAGSLRNALCMEKDFRDRPVKVAVAESRGEPKRGDRQNNPLGGLSATERRQRERDTTKRSDRPERGLRPTAFDKDEEEAEWMAKRVQEAVKVDSDGNDPESPASIRVKKDENKSNPFGGAKPR
jgi:hypothetical protein